LILKTQEQVQDEQTYQCNIFFHPSTMSIKTSAWLFFSVFINTTLLVSTTGVHTLSQLGTDVVFHKYICEISLWCFLS